MSDETRPSNFVREIVEAHNRSGRFGGKVITRFPPEPNGYLHIGHAKAICLDFGLAKDYGGHCNLRFDDTNPIKESQEYVDAIMDDIRWLGFDWGPHLYHASDYFEKLYEWAVELIRKGKAYVDDLSGDQIREHRGTLTEPGRESPHRNRSVDENLDLLGRMRAGEFPDGAKTLRAKIDMASGNINLRDPVMYRIRKATHQRTGDAWCIYPMYDWAHGQSDSIEGVTHSICTLEYEDHRPLGRCLDACAAGGEVWRRYCNNLPAYPPGLKRGCWAVALLGEVACRGIASDTGGSSEANGSTVEVPMKTRIGVPVATTELREAKPSRRRIIVSLGRPRKVADGDWACPYRIRGLGGGKIRHAHGFDAVQALVLGIESVRVTLDRSGRRFSCLGGEPGDTGFPRYVPTAFGPEFAKRLSRLIDREVEHFARMAEKRHRARRSVRPPVQGR